MRIHRCLVAVHSLLSAVALLAGCTSDEPPITNPRTTSVRASRSASGVQVADLGNPTTGGPFDPGPLPCFPQDPGEPDFCDSYDWIGTGLRAVAINRLGDVAVQARGLGDRFPVVWERDTFGPSLPRVDGKAWVITAINNVGEAVGWLPGFSAGTAQSQAVRFADGVASLLPTGSGDVFASRAWGINDLGDIVGARLFGNDPFGDGVLPRATLWRRSGEVIDLGALDPGRGSEAYSINNRGQAVGVSGSNQLSPMPTAGGAVRPVLFEMGQVTDLGGSPSCTGVAYAVNDRGQAAGQLCGRATRWDNGGAVALATPLGAVSSGGFGINNSGDVVGRILFPRNPEDPYRDYIFLGQGVEPPYQLDALLKVDFNTLPALWRGSQLTMLPMLSGAIRGLGSAYAVNNRGQIVGVNLVDERTRPVLWTITGASK